MSNITNAWEKERLSYQQRYVSWLKKLNETHSDEAKGHLHECSYVLLNIFGLTCKQLEEVAYNYSGFTNDDLN